MINNTVTVPPSTGRALSTVGLTTYAPGANVNNQVLPAGDGFRFTATANREITGMVAGAAGRTVMFYNGSTNDLKFKHTDANSTAGNRFFCPEATDFTLKRNDGAVLQYDAVYSAWVFVSTSVKD